MIFAVARKLAAPTPATVAAVLTTPTVAACAAVLPNLAAVTALRPVNAPPNEWRFEAAWAAEESPDHPLFLYTTSFRHLLTVQILQVIDID